MVVEPTFSFRVHKHSSVVYGFVPERSDSRALDYQYRYGSVGMDSRIYSKSNATRKLRTKNCVSMEE